MFTSTVRASLLALASLAVAVSAAPSLSLKVTGPDAVDSVEHLKIVATITNTGSEAVKVLNDPRGPLSKMPTDTFRISDASGAAPSFSGIKVKYVPSTAANLGAYTTIAPGQSVTVEHALHEAYNFTTPGAGVYDIHANNLFYVVNEDSTVAPVHADVSDGHSARVSGTLAIARSEPSLQKRATFRSCSSSQQSSINTAIPQAQNYAATALSYANSHTSSTTRYTTWFGTYTASRHSTITSHYSKISGGSYSGFTYDCSCTDSGTYAYVYPGTYGVMYFCGAYWSAPTTGTDSKAGTMIHEASHYTANGGTDDYVYGQSGAKSLAKSNPDQAVFNADNHEYFAENNPSLA